LMMVPAVAGAEGLPRLAPVCAERDLQAITLIEEHGEAQTVGANTLANAFTQVIQARGSCSAGRVSEALRAYDGISLQLVVAQRAQ
jgi:hypothetical protein